MRLCVSARKDGSNSGRRRTSFAHQRSYSCGDLSPTDADHEPSFADDQLQQLPQQLDPTGHAGTGSIGDYHDDDEEERRPHRDTSTATAIAGRDVALMDNGKQ